jgi:hypothetical protein
MDILYRLIEGSDIVKTLTAYQKSIEIVVLNATAELTIAEIAEDLARLGWTGEALEEAKIRQALSELAIMGIREA